MTTSTPKIVKRYANRKLYDTERSCYVTLEDISNMIKLGDEVQVIDNKTGDDLTSVTLAQIIFEIEKKKRSFMPLALLRGLIQERSDALGMFARDQVGKAQARAQDVVETASSLRESAVRLRSQVSDRLDRAVGNADSTSTASDGSDEPSDDKSGRYKLLVDMAAASRETLASLHEGVQHKVFKPGSKLGVEIEDIRNRVADIETRLRSFIQ